MKSYSQTLLSTGLLTHPGTGARLGDL